MSKQHDTVPLPGAAGWQDTLVMGPELPTTPAGWYDDPYDPQLYRYWDGSDWTDYAAPVYQRPSRDRRSVGLAFALAIFFGVFAFVYLLPLPAWARLLVAVAGVWFLGLWSILVFFLTWPFAVFAVPLAVALTNRSRGY